MNASEVGGDAAQVLLHWLPLGAGAHVVAWNGRLYEACCARLQRRPRAALFHAALSLRSAGSSYVVEMGPAWGNATAQRGVLVEGPVGLRALARSRFFRYEVRAWRDGSIPDLAFAVGAPTLMSADPDRAARLLGLVPQLPALTWGRDELGLGEMWNSNSVVAWLLLRSGHDLRDTRPPTGGRAPGWSSGVALASSECGARPATGNGPGQGLRDPHVPESHVR